MSLSKSDIIFMAICTGLIVSNLYYCQPLIVLIAKEFNVLESTAGTVTYLTQAGYAIGLFFMVPLGDKLERKKQILFTTFAAVIALVLASFSANFLMLQIASFLIGAASIVPQLILPLAANLSTDQTRGKVVGTIMSGLLIGILISRTVSGYLGMIFGWRGMFIIAAVLCLIICVFIQKRFPISKTNFSGTYQDLLKSLFVLIKEQTVLRSATAINALSFAQFGAFWTVMVLLLSDKPFEYSSAQIGLFGLVGACGAFAAPVVGKLGDKGDSSKVVFYGGILMLLSFIVFYFSAQSIFGMILGIVFIDLGLQAIHVSNQTRIYSMLPEARNRLNTVFMSFSFLGTAIGSAFGLWLWNLDKWNALTIGCGMLAIVSLIIYFLTRSVK